MRAYDRVVDGLIGGGTALAFVCVDKECLKTRQCTCIVETRLLRTGRISRWAQKSCVFALSNLNSAVMAGGGYTDCVRVRSTRRSRVAV